MLQLNKIFRGIENHHHIDQYSEASRTQNRSEKVSDDDSHDWRCLCVSQFLQRSLLDLTKDEEELQDRGYLENAHNNVEVVGDYRCLYSHSILLTIIFQDLGSVVEIVCWIIDYASDYDNHGA